MKIILVFLVLCGLLGGCSKPNIKSYEPTQAAKDVLNGDSIFSYNTNFQERDSLLKIKSDWVNIIGEIAYFEELNVRTLDTLIAKNFANPRDQQNDAPTIREIFLFMAQYPQVQAAGYAVSPTRDDYRITIDALYVPGNQITDELRREFVNISKEADERTLEGDLSCWWD